MVQTDRRSRVIISLFLLLSLAGMAVGVFIAPYLVPQPGALLSVSALAGFNNSLAYALYVLFLGLVIYLATRLSPTRAEPAEPLVASRPSLVPPPIVTLVLGLHVVLFGALYAFKHGFVFAEALYFQDLLYRMKAGAVPFVDVHFFYGPALLYPALFLTRYVGIELAYAVYYVATYVVGLYLIYVVLGCLLRSHREAQAWFVFFALGLFNPYTGLNYAIVRHMLPVVALLAAWWCFRAPGVGSLAGTVVVVTLALVYSPEIGVVTLLSVGTLSALVLLRPSGGLVLRAHPLVHLAVPVSSAALMVLLFHVIDPSYRALASYFELILTFSSGGWNTPIDPSLPTLTMIALTIMVGVVIVRTVRSRGWDESAVWLVSYGVLILLMERAAFGKADISHIAYSGLPLYLLAVRCAPGFWTWNGKNAWMAVLLFVGLVGPQQLYHGMLFLPYVERSVVHAQGMSGGHASGRSSATKEAIQAGIARAVEQFGRDRLYYMHKLEYYRLPIYLRFGLEPILYFPSLTSAFTDKDMRGVIDELRERRAIVIARQADLEQLPPAVESGPHWLMFLTSSPLPGSAVYDLTNRFQARLEAPLLEFLKAEYDIGLEDGEIVALLPREVGAKASEGLRAATFDIRRP